MAGFYESLNKQNYLKAMSGAYQNYGITPDNINSVNSGEINSTISLSDNIKNAQSSAEQAVNGENHDSDPSWWTKSMNAIDNIFNNVFEGIFNFADAIGDFGMGIVGGIAGAAGNHQLEKTMKKAINTDWQANATQVVNAMNKTLRPSTYLDPNSGTDVGSLWSSIGNSEEARSQLNKVKYGTFFSDTDFGKGTIDFTSNVAQGLGEMIPSLGVGAAVGAIGGTMGASTAAQRTANIVTQASLGFMTGAGKGYSTVSKEDGSLAKGSGYAAVKGLISGATRAGSAAFGGSYSDKAMNKVGVKTAEAILGHGGSEKLAKAVSSIASIASDAAIEGGVDFVTSLADPVLKQIYDDEAIKKAYGDDRWKSTLANAGMAALTTALTTAITDSVRLAGDEVGQKEAKRTLAEKREKLLKGNLGVEETESLKNEIATLEQSQHDTKSEQYVKEARDNNAVKRQDLEIKQATELMAEKNENGKLEAMQDLQRRAKANEQIVLNAKKEAEKALEKQGDIMRSLLTQGLTIDDVQNSEAFKQATAEANAKVNEMEAAANKANETSEEILNQAREYNDISKEAERTKADKTEEPLPYNNVTDKKLVQENADKKGNYDLSEDVSAKIDKSGKILYRAKDLDNTIFLMTQTGGDDKEGRIVRIDREYTGNGTELKVDTSIVGQDEIKGFARTLESDNTTNVCYFNKATKETYIENNGGSRFMFKDGVYQGMVTERPDWATKQNIETWESRSSLSGNSMSLIKQASEIGYISESDAVSAIDGILENDSMLGSNDGSVKTAKEDGWFRKLSTSYALSKSENERMKSIKGAYTELTDKVTSNGGVMPMSEDDFTKVVKDYLDEVQKHTSNQKKISSLEDKIQEGEEKLSKSQDKISNLKDKIQGERDKRIAMKTEYRSKLAKLTQEISKIKEYNKNLDSQEHAYNVLSNKFKREGTKDASNKPYEKMNPYVEQYKALRFDRKSGGFDPQSIKQVLFDGVSTFDDDGKPTSFIINYDQDSLENAGLGYLYDPYTKDIIDDLKSHFDKDGNYVIVDDDGKETVSNKLSMEDSEAMTGLVSRLNKMTNISTMVAKAERKAKFMSLVTASESLKEGNPRRGGVGNVAQQMLNSTLGMPERMRILLGEGTPAYNLLVTKVQQNWLNAKYQKKEITDDMNRMIEKHGINQQESSSGEIKYTQFDGSESKMKKGQAMELYLQSLSPDNYEKLKRDGFTTKEPGRTQKAEHLAVTDEIIDQIVSQFTPEEKAFCEDLFQNGYNGLSKNILNKYTTKNYGYAQFNQQNYVNRTIETDQTNINFDNPDSLQSGFVSTRENLNNGIAKKRNGNRNAMAIGDIFQHYDSYADQVARFTCLDDVRDLDVAMNMRGSQTKLYVDGEDGEKTEKRGFSPTSIYANFDGIEGGKQLIENWLKVANGLPANGNGGGNKTVSTILNNAVATPIGLNPGTYLKMYLDPLRLIGKEVAVTDQKTGVTTYKKITWGNFFKGLLNSFNERTRSKNATDTFTTIQSGSKYYAAANMDNYAVSSNVYGAKMNKAMQVFGKPLESANNAMMSHIVFPTLQAFAESNGYGTIGDDKNTTEALNLFDAVSVTALSNGDPLDVSDLRAGRVGGPSGGIIKAVFGLYGGDSQKKAEQISDVFLGNARSKRRVEGLQKMIDKYEGNNGNVSVINEYRQREEEAKLKYEKLLAKQGEMSEEDAKKFDFRVLVAKSKWESAQSQTKALADSIQGMKDQIVFEKEHVQDKKNNVAKAGYVFSAFAMACAIEGGINVLTSKMKDKDEEVTLASYGKDLGSAMLVDWIPYVGTIASAFKYSQSGFTPLQFQGLQEAVTSFKSLAKAANDPTDGNKWNKAVLNMLNTLGYTFGVPVKNFIDYTSGAIGNIDNMTGNKMTWIAKTNTIMKGYNSTTLKSKATSYANQGNLSKATEYTQANMAFYKAGAVDWNTAREIAKTGATVKDRPTGTASDTDRFMNIYAKSNSAVKRYIGSYEYSRLEDDKKGSAITKIYNAFYEVSNAIQKQDESALTSTLGKALYKYYSGKKLTNEQKALLRKYKII